MICKLKKKEKLNDGTTISDFLLHVDFLLNYPTFLDHGYPTWTRREQTYN